MYFSFRLSIIVSSSIVIFTILNNLLWHNHDVMIFFIGAAVVNVIYIFGAWPSELTNDIQKEINNLSD